MKQLKRSSSFSSVSPNQSVSVAGGTFLTNVPSSTSSSIHSTPKSLVSPMATASNVITSSNPSSCSSSRTSTPRLPPLTPISASSEPVEIFKSKPSTPLSACSSSSSSMQSTISQEQQPPTITTTSSIPPLIPISHHHHQAASIETFAPAVTIDDTSSSSSLSTPTNKRLIIPLQAVSDEEIKAILEEIDDVIEDHELEDAILKNKDLPPSSWVFELSEQQEQRIEEILSNEIQYPVPGEGYLLSCEEVATIKDIDEKLEKIHQEELEGGEMKFQQVENVA